MKVKPSAKSLALCVLSALVFVGCGTTTTVKLTGTPGTQVSGRFRATHVSSDFTGTGEWQMDFGRQRMEEFEFQKAAVDQPLSLEIREGRRLLVKATAEPGTLGLRVRRVDGWRVEIIR